MRQFRRGGRREPIGIGPRTDPLGLRLPSRSSLPTPNFSHRRGQRAHTRTPLIRKTHGTPAHLPRNKTIDSQGGIPNPTDRCAGYDPLFLTCTVRDTQISGLHRTRARVRERQRERKKKDALCIPTHPQLAKRSLYNSSPRPMDPFDQFDTWAAHKTITQRQA